MPYENEMYSKDGCKLKLSGVFKWPHIKKKEEFFSPTHVTDYEH